MYMYMIIYGDDGGFCVHPLECTSDGLILCNKSSFYSRGVLAGDRRHIHRLRVIKDVHMVIGLHLECLIFMPVLFYDIHLMTCIVSVVHV